jgi:hypothetical protein
VRRRNDPGDASLAQTDAGASTAEHKQETMHAPTNRVGAAVPTMRSAKNKDETTGSKTYNNSTKTE